MAQIAVGRYFFFGVIVTPICIITSVIVSSAALVKLVVSTTCGIASRLCFDGS
jgi:hypothetical protein